MNVILAETQTNSSYLFISQLHKRVLFQEEIPLIFLRQRLGLNTPLPFIQSSSHDKKEVS